MIFSDKQVDFMDSLGLNIRYNDMSDNDLCLIEESVSDKLSKDGFDKDYNINKIGLMCESILDILPK